MRKLLETIGLSALALTAWITWQALHGPTPLPDRIATHFNAAGNPNGWGSPSALLVLPAAGLGVYLLLWWVGRSPGEINLPVRITPQNRPRLEALATALLAALRTELACIFASIQWATIQAARHPERGFPAALIPASLALVFATVACFLAAMLWVGRASFQR